jgi:hypothetical protein
MKTPFLAGQGLSYQKTRQLLRLLFIFVFSFLPFSHLNANPANLELTAFVASNNIQLEMYRLVAPAAGVLNPGAIVMPPENCSLLSARLAYGCTFIENNATYAFPYAQSISATVAVETDYLLDVVAQELSPEQYDQPIATKALAIAARSYTWYFVGNPPQSGFPVDSPYNNSTKYQVFIPYRFEMLDRTLGQGPNIPNNAANPCASTNLNVSQTKVCNAVKDRYYVAFDGFDLPAKALHGADVRTQTVADPSKDYLKSVSEPISTVCDADNSGQGYGLSQEGAVRWARGNQCARPVSGNIPWTVKWTKPEQILFHYYTDVNLRDAGHNNAILSTSPQFRWNPLELNGVPAVFTMTSPLPPLPYGFGLWVQNTGTISWSCISQSSGDPKSNRMKTQVVAVPSGVVLTSATTNFCVNFTANPGERWSFNGASVYISAYCGDAKIVYDLGVVTNVSGATTYGSTNGWGVYEKPIVLRTAPCKVYLPNIQKD